MKKLSKVIAVFLAALMAATLLCLPSFAEEIEDPYAFLKEGTGYVAIGDSFTRGYGASDHWEDQLYRSDNYGSNNNDHGDFNCRYVDGAYPTIVADEFGLSTSDRSDNDIRNKDSKFWNLAHDAVSTAYVLDLLGIDDGYRDDEFTYQDGSMINRYKTDLAYYGDPESYTLDGTARYGKTGEVMSIRELLSNASLITLEVGQTDIIYKAQILGLNKMDLSDTAKIPEGVADIISRLYRYYDYWTGAYPLLLDFIKENNPDAKVVLVGTMNPIQNATISEELLLPIGSALNIIMDLMNKFNRECAEKYGYMFVDISNVETPSVEQELTLPYIMSLTGVPSGLMAHPTPSGYAAMGRSVIDTLKKDIEGEAYDSDPKTFIKVDLGRFEKVDYVTVDGTKVEDFTVSGHVLTIPCYFNNAKNLTVAIVNEDNSISLATYGLQYDNGYTAYRIYESNNIFKTISTTLKMIFEKIISFFKGLFA